MCQITILNLSTMEISQNFLAFSEYMNFNLLYAKFDSKKIGRPLWTFHNHKFFQPICWKDAYKNVRFIMWKIAFYLVSFTWLSATSITMFLTAAQMCRVFSFDCTITWVNIFFKSTQKMHLCQGYLRFSFFDRDGII